MTNVCYTYKMLEDMTEFSHPQIKRWAVALFGSEPHKGSPIYLSKEQAIKIVLMGKILKVLDCKIKPLAKIINSWDEDTRFEATLRIAPGIGLYINPNILETDIWLD